jgi:RNA-directed DNA polymerase
MEPLERKMKGTSSPETVSTRLQRIAELAKQAPDMVLTTLSHHIDIEMLREAYRCTRKDGAVGVDGQTAQEYSVDLEANLQSLLHRFKSGTYKAPPVLRVHIAKSGGRKTRPIGIPAFEDKVLQRAVTMVLGAVYEEDFLDCSYGFRPGRSAHQALEDLWRIAMNKGGGWVLEIDIQGFFDALDRRHLRGMLDQRVRDGVLRRTIDKWLKAGVLEAGGVVHPEFGTPQGGVISPLLANIYLHEVVDRWFVDMVQPRLSGSAHLIRYADDMVMMFAKERDARRVLDVLPKRLGKYGLALHPEKTRLVDFLRPRGTVGENHQSRKRPGTFDLLGFTMYWGLSRRGYWVVQRRTARDRFSRSLRAINTWCKRYRHSPIEWQHRALSRKLRGHCAYYGITGNGQRLWAFRNEVIRIWQTWLSRRSQRGMRWDDFRRLTRYSLPPALVVHSVYRHVANP